MIFVCRSLKSACLVACVVCFDAMDVACVLLDQRYNPFVSCRFSALVVIIQDWLLAVGE